MLEEKDQPEYDFIRQLSQKYQIPFRLESLEESVRGYKIEDEIVLNRHLPPERRNWTFCHELGHIILGHSARPNDLEEREADACAAELMLPERDFAADAANLDLDKLKALYPHASYEVLARRCLQYMPALLTIFDNGEITFRAASFNLAFPKRPAPIEMEVFSCCLNNKAKFEKSDDTMNVKGWYIDQRPPVIRIILISEPLAGVD